MIDDLNNGNWVEEGLSYLEHSDNKCPFCQQDITKEFINKIYGLYDGKYKKEKDEFFLKRNSLINKIDELSNEVEKSTNKLSKKLTEIEKEVISFRNLNEDYFRNTVTLKSKKK